jgi:hypothetical protein
MEGSTRPLSRECSEDRGTAVITRHSGERFKQCSSPYQRVGRSDSTKIDVRVTDAFRGLHGADL